MELARYDSLINIIIFHQRGFQQWTPFLLVLIAKFEDVQNSAVVLNDQTIKKKLLVHFFIPHELSNIIILIFKVRIFL